MFEESCPCYLESHLRYLLDFVDGDFPLRILHDQGLKQG